MQGHLKTADLADAAMLGVVADFNDHNHIGMPMRDLERELSAWPPKLVVTKCRKLIKRDLLSGSTSVHPGLEVTEEGRTFLDSEKAGKGDGQLGATAQRLQRTRG